MGGLHADCGLLAEQFRNIKSIVTHWTNYLVFHISQRAHHSPLLLVLGTRKAVKAVIASIGSESVPEHGQQK